jgi:hypothetical protein
MKALTVDFELIAQSMRDLSRLTNEYFLDRNSGKIIALSRTLIRAFEQGRDQSIELPNWEAPLIPLAREIILSGSPKYIRVPEAFGCPEHKWMSDYALKIQNSKLRQRLQQTLRGRGCCDRFKLVIKDHPEESQAWTQYRMQRWHELVQKWLENIGILGVHENIRKSRTSVK